MGIVFHLQRDFYLSLREDMAHLFLCSRRVMSFNKIVFSSTQSTVPFLLELFLSTLLFPSVSRVNVCSLFLSLESREAVILHVYLEPRHLTKISYLF